MHFFSTSGKNLTNFSLRHVHIQKPFFYLLPSVTKAKRELLWRNKPLLSISIYQVSAAAGAQNPLLWALIRIHTCGLFRYDCSHRSTEQTYLLWFISSEEEDMMTKCEPSYNLWATPPLLKLCHDNWTWVYV